MLGLERVLRAFAGPFFRPSRGRGGITVASPSADLNTSLIAFPHKSWKDRLFRFIFDNFLNEFSLLRQQFSLGVSKLERTARIPAGAGAPLALSSGVRGLL